MKKEERAFIDSFHGYRTIRFEIDGSVILGDGCINVSRNKLVLISNNNIVFEAKKKDISFGLLMSGDGVRIKGYNLVTGKVDAVTAYFSYVIKRNC